MPERRGRAYRELRSDANGRLKVETRGARLPRPEFLAAYYASLPDRKGLAKSNEHLKLFKGQQLVASGEAFFKMPRFQRSKRYYAELRGLTLVILRAEVEERPGTAKIGDVISVFNLNQYHVYIEKRDGGNARVCVGGNRAFDGEIVYIRIKHSEEDLTAWRKGLTQVIKYPLPNLSTLRIESIIGRGGGGKVFMVQSSHDRKCYALKVIDKIHTFKSAKSFRHVSSERLIMQRAGQHPFLLQLEFAFQSDDNLFIASTFCPGGDLASYIKQKGNKSIPFDGRDYVGSASASRSRRYPRLSEEQTKFIAAQILLGLQHLHARGIVYRDLKPENVFIDENGHVKIGDYGLAKHLQSDEIENGRLRTASICGTRNYLPPEMLAGKKYSFESDLWSFGVMLYRIMTGVFPFDGQRTKEVFQRIKNDRLHMPSWLSAEARELLHGLLQKEPRKRLTIEKVRGHAFFRGVDWDAVLQKRSLPSIPNISLGDKMFDALDNFDLSKLEGVSVGDYLNVRVNDELHSSVSPSHKRDPRGIMIGFEYVSNSEEQMNDGRELVVKQRSGGLFARITSLDFDQLPSPRSIFSIASR